MLNLVTKSREFEELMHDFFPGQGGDPLNNFCAHVYESSLDRMIDQDGLDYWIWLMTSRRDQRTAALEGLRDLFNSSEFDKAAPTVPKKVECLYLCFLDRYPTPEESAHWTSEIRSKHKTLNQCLTIFGQSPGFSAILNRFFPGREIE
jgi:hypothetical protein